MSSSAVRRVRTTSPWGASCGHRAGQPGLAGSPRAPARAGAVEALGADQLAELQARAAQLLDLLVYRRAAVVENLEHLVLLRFAQAERAQLHRVTASFHATLFHRLRQCQRGEAEREAAGEKKAGDVLADHGILLSFDSAERARPPPKARLSHGKAR